VKPLIIRSAKILSRTFLQGLIVFLPIAVTAAIIYWLAALAEDLLGALVRLFIPDEHYTKGLGMLIGILLVFALGLMMKTWATRHLLARAEALMERIPIIKSIYGSIRDLAAYFSKHGAQSKFQHVVTVSIADNMRLVGFLTRENATELPGTSDGAEEIVGVYLPMSYQIGGYTVFVPRSAVERMEMSVEDAMRFVLTAGMSSSKDNGAAVAASTAPHTESGDGGEKSG
jgi:uncharacterized membrane protein